MSLPNTDNAEVAMIAAAMEMTATYSPEGNTHEEMVTNQLRKFLMAYKAIRLASARLEMETREADSIDIEDIIKKVSASE